MGRNNRDSEEDWCVFLEQLPIKWDRKVLKISLLSHVLFGKPVSTHRVKPEGMLFREML
jgi:hypothetical protein